MRTMIPLRVLLGAVSCLAIFLATSAVARAETPAQDLLHDRFVVDVGTFLVGTNLNGGLSSISCGASPRDSTCDSCTSIMTSRGHEP